MPGGRPAAATRITDNVLAPNIVLAEHWTLLSLHSAIPTTAIALQWLAARSLLANSHMCPNCNELCRLNSYTEVSDGCRWRCRCGYQKSVRYRSFFANSNIPIRKLICYLCGTVNRQFKMYVKTYMLMPSQL